MKKIFSFLFTVLLSMTVNAANPLKVNSGSIAFLSTGSTAQVEFDFSNSTWEKDETLKQQFEDEYDNLIAVSHSSFVDAFNSSSNKLKFVDNASNPQYKIIFKFDNFQAKVGTLYRKYVRIWGSATVIDLSSNETVCSIQITKLEGSNDYVTKEAFWKSFKKMGELLAKMK